MARLLAVEVLLAEPELLGIGLEGYLAGRRESDSGRAGG
jgi:hypothetical protein